MIAPFALALLISPFDLVEASIDRAVFPKRADNWDRIGIFKLKDGAKDRLVLLYYYDRFSVDEKMSKKEGFVVYTSPNVLYVHAVYKDKAGKWTHKEVIHHARVNFTKVATAAPDHLILECRPNFLLSSEPGEDIGKTIKRMEEINKPFTRQVSFVDGVLTAK